MKKGHYIILESGEGFGKDYQANLLQPWLISRGLDVVLTREPGGTREAEQIRKVLLGLGNDLSDETEFFLYEAARRDLNEKVISPSLDAGKFVLSKRGFPSTHAYQGFAGGIDLETVERANNLAMRGYFPDLVFIIDGDPEEGLLKELDPDRFAAKGLEYHQKVREGYLDFTKKYSDISVVIPYLKNRGEEMQNQIRKCLVERLNI